MKNTLINSSITNQSVYKILSVLQNPSKILKDKGATMEIFHAVAKQPDIFSASQNYRDAISAMEYVATDKWIQNYLLQSGILEQITRHAVSARDYGLAILEVVQYEKHQNKIVPTQLDLCPVEKFHFDSNRKLRLKQTGSALGILLEEAYPNKFMLVQNDATYSNPYGAALLDIAYWLSVGLNGNFEFMMQFAEEDGRDKWLGTYHPDATEEQKEALLLILAKLGANGIAIHQEGTNIEPKDFKNRSSSTGLYKDINELLLRKVEKLWYGTDLTMQVGGKGGYSSSQTGINIREDALSQGKLLVKNALKTLTQFINNINSCDIVSDFIITAKNETTKEEAEVDKIYFDMGLNPTAEFFKKRGYEDSEFTLVEKQQQTTDVIPAKAGISKDFEANNNLKDIFDIFKEDLSTNIKK